MPPPLTALEPARAPDAFAVRDLRDDLARWQVRIGVRQWAVGEVSAQPAFCAVRDTKNGDQGHLAFAQEEWTAALAAAKK
ncbi:DUF397 domain-containing protein [Nocardiopsis nanhaiensis]